MADFKVFAEAIRKRFNEIKTEPLFQVASDRDEIWTRYLGAFTEGSDPIFRTRREHDCSCCRHFIRSTGNVVAIQNGALSSIWDLNGLPEPYQAVADAMSAYIKGLEIRDVFVTKDRRHGIYESTGFDEASGRALRFNHFCIDIPAAFTVRNGKSLAEHRGGARTTHQVLMRGLTELTPEAVATVADLIKERNLYRGEQYAQAVNEFQALQQRFLASAEQGKLLAWTMIGSPAARFRNTAIGTLVQDLSAGMELEKAVRRYDTTVAPANYQRPTALITKHMVEDAMKTIRELDLEPALERRHAKLSDVSVGSVLFVDNAVRKHMKGGLEDLLMKEVKAPKFDPAAATEIGIEAFLRDVLPKASAVSLYLGNGLARNFMSLTAPVHADTPPLFRWGNGFAWAYEGNLADSDIKAKVKAAGGMVEGVTLRVSLAWSNFDDLDLHCLLPGGIEVYYGNKIGILDIDMNAGGGHTREPVENMRWPQNKNMRDGNYLFWVHNFAKRESIDTGFSIEVECEGRLESYRYEKALANGEKVQAATVRVSGGRITEVQPGPAMEGGARSREHWGLKTLDFVRVNSIVLSPNYWGREIEPDNGLAVIAEAIAGDQTGSGHRHWFFILDGCVNPLPARGVFNEYLHPRFHKHRKVFEVLGDKTKCQPAGEQLSGVGFTSGRGDKVTVAVAGPGLNRPYTIVF